jgi:hypothetical protein
MLTNENGAHATLVLSWLGRAKKTWLLTEYDERLPAAENILFGSGNPVSGASEPSSPLTGSSDSSVTPSASPVKSGDPLNALRGTASPSGTGPRAVYKHGVVFANPAAVDLLNNLNWKTKGRDAITLGQAAVMRLRAGLLQSIQGQPAGHPQAESVAALIHALAEAQDDTYGQPGKPRRTPAATSSSAPVRRNAASQNVDFHGILRALDANQLPSYRNDGTAANRCVSRAGALAGRAGSGAVRRATRWRLQRVRSAATWRRCPPPRSRRAPGSSAPRWSVASMHLLLQIAFLGEWRFGL